jgi:hypothetical protein
MRSKARSADASMQAAERLILSMQAAVRRLVNAARDDGDGDDGGGDEAPRRTRLQRTTPWRLRPILLS